MTPVLAPIASISDFGLARGIITDGQKEEERKVSALARPSLGFAAQTFGENSCLDHAH